MSTKAKGKGRRTTSPSKIDNLRCRAASVGRRAAENVPPFMRKGPDARPDGSERFFKRWIGLLSPPVLAAVLETSAAHGYGDAELEEWIADALSTAYRSPSGLILRIGKKRKAEPEHAAALERELPLFNGDLEEEPAPEGSAP